MKLAVYLGDKGNVWHNARKNPSNLPYKYLLPENCNSELYAHKYDHTALS